MLEGIIGWVMLVYWKYTWYCIRV